MQFREFLLNENINYLPEKIGNILSILHATQEEKDGLGSRDIAKDAERVVNQIKPILNIPKGPKEVKTALQKVAVAISKSMEEEKGDELLDIMSRSSKVIEKLLSDMGAPIQSLGTPSDAEEPQDQDAALQPPIEPEQPQQPQQQPEQPQQQPQQPVAPQPQAMQQMPQG